MYRKLADLKWQYNCHGAAPHFLCGSPRKDEPHESPWSLKTKVCILLQPTEQTMLARQKKKIEYLNLFYVYFFSKIKMLLFNLEGITHSYFYMYLPIKEDGLLTGFRKS